MKDILPELEDWMARGEQVALATVVRTWGSSPREVGAKMALTASGKICGSVSGGCVEGAVYEAGSETLKTGRPQLLHFGVADETAWSVGLACGGSVDVFVQPLTRELFQEWRRRLEAGKPFAAAIVIRGPEEFAGAEMLAGKADAAPEAIPVTGRIGSELAETIAALAEQALEAGSSRITPLRTTPPDLRTASQPRLADRQPTTGAAALEVQTVEAAPTTAGQPTHPAHGDVAAPPFITKTGSPGQPAAPGVQGAHGEQTATKEQTAPEEQAAPGERAEIELFIEVVQPQPVLVIIGAVHTAIALARLAEVLGFQTVVVDPRRAFGSPDRFPQVDRLIQLWPDDAFEGVSITGKTAIAILTHDPKIDDPALHIALRSPAFYIGALGSPTTQEKRRKRLLEAGITEEQLARLHGPIGLKLGGRTPEEIALAVMAEIVAVKNKTLA